jgi:hypothetical protein
LRAASVAPLVTEVERLLSEVEGLRQLHVREVAQTQAAARERCDELAAQLDDAQVTKGGFG